jgi:hypothetical protein
VYDKAKESKQPEYENCWRYEIEYKDEQAPAVFAALSAVGGRAEATLQILVDQFGEWGVCVPASLLQSGDVLRVPSIPRRDEQTERWLFSQVLPTLARLIDGGRQDIVDKLFRHAYNESSG